jgi:gliding motility-associated-like protein
MIFVSPLKPFVFLALFCSMPFIFRGQCVVTAPSATLSGNTCLNSLLSVGSSSPLTSVTWLLNGSPIATQTATYAATGTTVAGNAFTQSGNGASMLLNPDRICIDDNGNIYIPDLGNSRIQKWAPGASSGITVAGGNGIGSGMAQFNRPTSVAVDALGNIYVTDQSNNRIQKWAPGAITGTTIANDIVQPTDIFVDKQGNIYASDQTNRIIKKWTPGNSTGTVVVNASGYMSAATGIFIDEQGNIYLCDTDNSRVLRWAAGSSIPTVAAGGNGYGSAPNQLANPLDIEVDCAGNVFVADYNNHRIQKWAPGSSSGVTVFGTGVSGNSSNQLENPIGICLDKELNLYVSEFYNHRVQKIAYTISKTYTAVSPGIYSATVANSCCTSVTGSIEVYDIKKPGINISSDATSVCEGMPVNFSASYVDGGIQPHFQWYKNNERVGNNTPSYSAADLANGDIVRCVLTSSETCVNEPTGISNNITVVVSKSGDVELGDRLDICSGAEIVLDVPAGYATYQWQDGSTGRSFRTGGEGLFWVKVTDACGNSFQDTVTVFIHPPATRFLPDDFAICSYDKIQLTSSRAFRSYQWSTDINTPAIDISTPGTYWLAGTDINGCVSHDTILVSLKPCPQKGIYVPNAFTPQKNGHNDIFKPKVAGEVKSYEFAVYNRYGQVVFSTTDPTQGWDGTIKGREQDSNLYAWRCRYQLDDEPAHVEKGTVMLIR